MHNLTRGDKQLAMQVAADPELLGEARRKYRKEIRSAGDTSDFNNRTWAYVHNEVQWELLGMPADTGVLPLTPFKIEIVGSCMKEGGYRSGKNYMTAIKRMHILNGHSWNEGLDQAAHDFNASTPRGMGPSRQSEPLPFDRVCAIDLDKKLTDRNFMGNANAVFPLVSFYLLRELEVGTARRGDMTFDHHSREVRLRLSVSKNDPEAKGCSRPWRCVCDDPSAPDNFRSCPYCAACHHKKYLDEVFRDGSRDLGCEDDPLFPDKEGNEMRPEKVLEFIEAVATECGEKLRNENGVRRFGKHSFRSTGAVWLSEMGLAMEKVKLIGRWNCGVVNHYVRLAPLRTIATEYKRGRTAAISDQIAVTTATKSDKVKAKLDEVAKHYENKIAELFAIITKVEAQSRPKAFVVNRRTGNHHKVLTRIDDVGTAAIAYCGFKYVAAPIQMLRELPSDLKKNELCATCLAEVRATLVAKG